MTTLTPGDEIVVEYRGTVDQFEDYENEQFVRLANRDPLSRVYLKLHAADEVRVLRKAAPVVGDVITSYNEFERLPLDSIMVGVESGCTYTKVDDDEVFTANEYDLDDTYPGFIDIAEGDEILLKVVYIPEPIAYQGS